MLMAVMLLMISPAVDTSMGRAVLLIYMWLPLYMVHQYEEYVLGDFLAWIRRAIPRNAAFLTDRKVLMINLGFVWMLYVLSFYAARAGNAAVALYAPYLAGVNGVIHVGWWARFRQYNPGLVTAVILFLPGALYTIVAFSGATRADHLAALGGAVLAHAVLVLLGRGLILKTL
jgi:hypothetical protein